MGLIELILLAVSLSMDAFAVSICKGLSTNKITWKHSCICGAWFGGFQALMPLIGFFLGTFLSNIIEKNKSISNIPPFIAFALLAFIGINMLREALSKECDCGEEDNGDLGFKTMLVMAIATSIDALAVGISLAMAGNVNIWLSILLIGLTTFTTSAFGVKIGSVFGDKFEKKAQMAGGAILILLGAKILLEHLGILA